jgi:PEP-CTERM motif
MLKYSFLRALSGVALFCSLFAGGTASAVPITITAAGNGNADSSQYANVIFTIAYAAGLPADEQTILSATFYLRGRDTNATFQNNAAVLGGTDSSLTSHVSFDNSQITDGILTVNIADPYFDSGDYISFAVGIKDLCAGCTGAGYVPDSAGTIGFNALLVDVDIKGGSTYSGYFSATGGGTALAQVSVPEPGALALLGISFMALGLVGRRRRKVV